MNLMLLHPSPASLLFESYVSCPQALVAPQGVSNRDIKLENTLLEAQQGRRHMLKLCGASPRCYVRHFC